MRDKCLLSLRNRNIRMEQHISSSERLAGNTCSILLYPLTSWRTGYITTKVELPFEVSIIFNNSHNMVPQAQGWSCRNVAGSFSSFSSYISHMPGCPKEPKWYTKLPTVFLMKEASNRNSYQLTISQNLKIIFLESWLQYSESPQNLTYLTCR